MSAAHLGATTRRVHLEVFESRGWDPGPEAMETLSAAIQRNGDPIYLRVVAASHDAPFAHLKVVVADGKVAYIGSAKITGAGLGGRNVELAVLVRGSEGVS